MKKRKTTNRVRIARSVKSTTPVLTAQKAAGVWRRFGGFLIDYLILGIPNSVIVWFLKDNGLYTPIAFYYNLLLVIIVLYYFIFFTFKNNGQTFGKVIAGTKVVSQQGKLKLSQIIVRYGVLFLLVQFSSLFKFFTGTSLDIPFLLFNVLAVLLVGILLIIDDEHRGIHDMIAGTWVIKSQKSNRKSQI